MVQLCHAQTKSNFNENFFSACEQVHNLMSPVIRLGSEAPYVSDNNKVPV